MRDLAAGIGAFVVGALAGVGYLFVAGDFTPKPPPPLPPIKITPPLVLAGPDAATAGPDAATVAGDAKDAGAPVADAKPDAGTAVVAVVAKPVPVVAGPAFGRFVIAGTEGNIAVDGAVKQTANKVNIPMAKDSGKVTVKSADGTWTIDIKYKSDGGALKASIDCSPMALISGGGMPGSTHLEVPISKLPTKIDFKGGAAGSYALLLQYVR